MVYFIVGGTGGSEIIHELLKAEKINFSFEVFSFTQHSKDKIPRSKKMNFKEILKHIILNHNNIKMIVSERSNHIEEHELITRLCNKLGILNFVILDFPSLDKEYYKKIFLTKPNLVGSINQEITEFLIQEGFCNEEQIIKTGNLNFCRFLKNKIKVDKDINFDKPKCIFVSQGGSTNYKHEYIRKVLLNFETLFKKHFEEFEIDLKLHPMEKSFYKKWESFLKNKKIKLLDIENKVDFLEIIIKEYDIVLGINSTLQFQAQLLGLPVLYEKGDSEKGIQKFKNRETDLMPSFKKEFYKIKKEEIIKKIEENIKRKRKVEDIYGK